MDIATRVPSRAGLAGNPSDGYGGRVVAVAIDDFGAWARLEAARGVRLRSRRDGSLALPSPADVSRSDTSAARHALALATCRRFLATALADGRLPELPGPADGFCLSYGCDIPERVGLAGSSALVVAILRALAERYDVAIAPSDLPTLALEVETLELGIHAGLMDRVVQVLGGLVYMDLSSSLIAAAGHGRYERLPPRRLPPLFLAWNPRLAAGSETVHNVLNARFRRREPELLAVMRDLAELADEARARLVGDSPRDLSDVMNRTFDLRSRLVDVGDGNRQLVEAGRRLGAGVNQAGSGGAIVGTHDGDPERQEALRSAYAELGAGFLVPSVAPERTGGSTGA